MPLRVVVSFDPRENASNQLDCLKQPALACQDRKRCLIAYIVAQASLTLLAAFQAGTASIDEQRRRSTRRSDDEISFMSLSDDESSLSTAMTGTPQGRTPLTSAQVGQLLGDETGNSQTMVSWGAAWVIRLIWWAIT